MGAWFHIQSFVLFSSLQSVRLCMSMNDLPGFAARCASNSFAFHAATFIIRQFNKRGKKRQTAAKIITRVDPVGPFRAAEGPTARPRRGYRRRLGWQSPSADVAGVSPVPVQV